MLSADIFTVNSFTFYMTPLYRTLAPINYNAMEFTGCNVNEFLITHISYVTKKKEKKAI